MLTGLAEEIETEAGDFTASTGLHLRSIGGIEVEIDEVCGLDNFLFLHVKITLTHGIPPDLGDEKTYRFTDIVQDISTLGHAWSISSI